MANHHVKQEKVKFFFHQPDEKMTTIQEAIQLHRDEHNESLRRHAEHIFSIAIELYKKGFTEIYFMSREFQSYSRIPHNELFTELNLKPFLEKLGFEVIVDRKIAGVRIHEPVPETGLVYEFRGTVFEQ